MAKATKQQAAAEVRQAMVKAYPGGEEMDESAFPEHSGRQRAVRILVAVLAYAILAAPVLASVPFDRSMIASSPLLAAVLVALTIIDIETYRLPDALTLPLAIAGVLLCAMQEWDAPFNRILAAVAGYVLFWLINTLYRKLRGRSGLGLGDAKLLAAAGAWLGLAELPGVILIAALSALAAVCVLALRGHQVSRTTMLPFGPFLAFGFWAIWLYGAYH